MLLHHLKIQSFLSSRPVCYFWLSIFFFVVPILELAELHTLLSNVRDLRQHQCHNGYPHIIRRYIHRFAQCIQKIAHGIPKRFYFA